MGQTRFSVGTIDRWSAVAARPGVQSSAERSNRARIHVRCVALDRFVCRLVASTAGGRLVASTAGGLNRTNAGLANRVTATSTLQRAYPLGMASSNFRRRFLRNPSAGPRPLSAAVSQAARLSRIADAPDANESAQFTWSFVLSEPPFISESSGTVNVPFTIKTLSSNSSFSTSGKAVP